MCSVWRLHKSLILHCRAAATACKELELREAPSDRSLNVMDSTPLPCDVHAHLMLKWPIHGTIVFQSCQGKVQNGAHFLLHAVITMAQFTARPSTLPEHNCPSLHMLFLFKDIPFLCSVCALKKYWCSLPSFKRVADSLSLGEPGCEQKSLLLPKGCDCFRTNCDRSICSLLHFMCS